MSDLTKIANSVGTDKGTTTGAAHGYTLIYEMLFRPLRHHDEVNLLELGLAIGGPELGGNENRPVAGSPSLELWLIYFRNAQIVGFDISDFSAIERESFTFVRGDAGKPSDLDKLTALNREFDVIIDDASHASFHQQLGLATLFKLLKPGGLYIIEDMGWRPQAYERTLPPVETTAKLLADFLRTGDLHPSAAITPAAALELKRSISSLILVDESTLTVMADNFNKRFGHAPVQRAGWRTSSVISRLLNPYFWLFNIRHIYQSAEGSGFTIHQAVKLAIIQKTDSTDPPESTPSGRPPRTHRPDA
jgi:SAM-dependent methyltransferase